MHRAAEGKELVPGYCGATAYLSAALHAHPPRGRQALVVGSLRPWVESVLLLSGASAPVTTVDFNPAPSQTHRIRTLGALEFRALSPPPRFDLVRPACPPTLAPPPSASRRHPAAAAPHHRPRITGRPHCAHNAGGFVLVDRARRARALR
jgi:hypothetical protein